MNPIIDLLDRRLQPYRISGDEARTRTCPFCGGGESNDLFTFSINLDTGFYTCFRGSCNAKGDFPKLASKLGETTDFTRASFKTQTVYAAPTSKLHDLTPDIISYFDGRGISEATLNAFGVSADDKGNIIFPFTFGGELIYVKHRKLHRAPNDPKEWADRDTRPILFGMDLCDTNLQSIIISEGQIDALSLYEAGVRNVLSVPAGCENLKWVEECWDWLDQFEQIVLFGDNDAPGKRMVSQLVKRLGEGRCKIVQQYPLNSEGHECKDANEILCECGDIALLDVLDDAKEVPIKGLINLADVNPVDPTTIPRIKTNIPALDACIGGLREGAVTVITGKAGDGKSVITGQILLNAIEQGCPVCAYSGELTCDEFQEWINLQAAGSDYVTLKHDPVKNKQVPVVPEDVAEAIRDWYNGKFFLYNNEEVFENNQSESIVNLFTAAHRRYGCRLFLVDNLLTAVSDSEEETRAQGKFVNVLKRFAKKYSVHVIIVAHARKLAPGKRNIDQDDISGNSAIVKLAHSALVIERPNIRVIKSRDSGHKRIIECCYMPDCRRIYQKDVGDLNSFSWDKSDIVKPKVLACDNPDYAVQVGEPEGEML